MSQGAPDLDCDVYVDQINIQQEAGFLVEDIPGEFNIEISNFQELFRYKQLSGRSRRPKEKEK